LTIVRYLDALYPTGHCLFGRSLREVTEVEMWQQQVHLQAIYPWQRQFQNGKGFPCFPRHVPRAAASAPSGLRKQVTSSLRWLKDQLEARASRMREVVADLKARCKGSPQLRLQRNLKGKVARYL